MDLAAIVVFSGVFSAGVAALIAAATRVIVTLAVLNTPLVGLWLGWHLGGGLFPASTDPRGSNQRAPAAVLEEGA